VKTTTECGNKYSDEGAVSTCDKTAKNHKLCSGWSDRIGGHIDWPNPEWIPPLVKSDTKTAEADLRAMAAKVKSGVEGSEHASRSWTDGERKLVELAIAEVAEQVDEFSTDEVWTALGDSVPMTAGMAAMLRAATTKGLIEPTDRYTDSRRDRADHDGGRRLRVWRSRVR
jgi:hypothetical protein